MGSSQKESLFLNMMDIKTLEILINSIKLTDNSVEKLHTLYTLPLEVVVDEKELKRKKMKVEEFIDLMQSYGIFTVGDLLTKFPDCDGIILKLKKLVRDFAKQLEKEILKKGELNYDSNANGNS